MAGHAMIKVRPAAAEVKNMLLKIKLDNVKRGKALVAMNQNDSNDSDESTRSYPAPFSFNGGGCCGGAHYIESPRAPRKAFASPATNEDTSPAKFSSYENMMPMHRNLHAFSLLGTTNSLYEHDLAEYYGAEIQPLKTSFEEMGSFTSMSKVIPATDSDKDVQHEFRRLENEQHLSENESKKGCSLDSFLNHCSRRLVGLPEPISRKWKNSSTGNNTLIDHTNPIENGVDCKQENIRVFQWNVLSQTLGTKNDNFVRCPKSALEWRTRRFRMLEEIARHDADVICLQEVDHFPLVKEALSCLGYDGHFVPKPDSPCLYLADNSGPDGCAIFYKTNRFDLDSVESRIVEVWSVQSNQVVLSTVLRSKFSQSKVVIATTHLKARNGALLSTLRNEQGKDLLTYLDKVSCNGKLPIICTGDFNAEPSEPVYQTVTEGTENISFQSAYAETTTDGIHEHQKEPRYTTWKIREDGEHIQTLDYIFYHSPTSTTNLHPETDHDNDIYNNIEDISKSTNHNLCNEIQVEKVLDFPTGEQITPDRVPSFAYASDHFSLLADFKLRAITSELEE